MSNLTKSLSKLDKALGSVNVNGIQKYSNELQKVVSTFDSLNAKTSGLSTGMQRISDALSSMSKVDFKDSGLNSVINAMNRLSKTDMSNFDTSKLGSMVSSLSALANMPDVSSGVNRLVSSLTKLASTENTIRNVARDLPLLTESIKKAVESLSTVGSVSESLNLFIQSLGRLATAGNKTGQTATQLSLLAEEVKKFFDSLSKVPSVNENVIRVIETLAQLAAAGGKVQISSDSVSRSFNQMSSSAITTERVILGVSNAFGRFSSFVISLGKRAASAMLNLGKAASSASQRIKQLSNPLSVVTNKLSDLYAKMFLAKRAVQLFISPIKSAMDYVETLNYFNAAFKQVAGNVDTDEWKKSGAKSAEAYANSFEERAKQLSKKLTGFEVSDTGDLTRTNTASLGLDPEKTMQYQATFAQMASSMGDTSETALKLSNALTMVGADLASVRNMNFEDVWQDMASGLTGMSRAMDKYGINIRNANMQQELYNLGINTSISNLTQADKTILRTIILLNNSQYAWGDLANTINQPVNQIRMLQSNFSSLARTIGSLFIPVLQTVLPYINAVTIALQRMFAYLAKVLGIKLSDSVASMGGISVDTSNIADDMDTVSDAIDNSNKNAKKLAKTLSVLSFDELNQLSSKADSNDTGTGSTSSNKGANAHIPALDTALDEALANYQKAWDKAFKSMSNRANKMADAIVNAFKKKDWDGLGKIMASGINWGMQKIYDAINWNNVGPTITKFTSAFTTAFNSLIKNTKFDLIGRTIGAGVNTIVNTMNQLLEGIKWEEIGKKFAEGITGLASEVDWGNLGNLLGNSFMKGWRIFTGFVENLPYADIGKDFADGLNGIFEKVDFTEIAHALATGLNGAFTTLATFAENFDWDSLVQNISNGISTFISEFDWEGNGQKLEIFLDNLLGTLVDLASKTDWEELGSKIGTFLSQIDWGQHLSELATAAWDVLSGVWSGLGESTAGKFLEGFLLFNLATKLLPIINNIGKVFASDTAVGGITSGITSMFSGALSLFKEGGAIYEGLSAGAAGLSGAFEALTGLALPVEVSVGIIVAAVVGFVASIKNAWDTSETFRSTVIGAFTKVKDSLVAAFNKIKDALLPTIDSVKNLASTFVDMYNNSPIKPIVVLFESLAASIVGTALSTAIDAVSTAFSGIIKIFQGGIDLLSGVFEILKGIFTLDFSTVAQGFKDVGSAIGEAFEGIGTVFLGVGKDLVLGLFTGITDALSTIGSWLKEHVFNPIVDNFKNLFGIHSPSTVFAEYGGFLMEGLMEGINNLKDKVTGIFSGIGDKIKGVWDWVTGHTSDRAKEMSNDVKDSTGQMKKDVDANFSEIEKSADASLQGISTSTLTNWGGSSEEVRKNVRQMKIDVSTGLGDMDKTVTSHFGSQYNIMTTKWQKAAERITGRGQILDSLETTLARRIPSMSKYFDKLSSNIVNSLGSLYYVGQNAAQSFANGFRAVHIPVPRLYISSWNTHRLYNGGWFQTPNFNVNWYKKGGLFDSASVIGVGEAGKEAVLPLENKKAMKSIADSIVSSSDGNMGLTKEEIMQAVAQGVSMAMMNNSGGSSNPQYIMNSISWNGREIAKVVTEAIKDENSRFNPSPAY